MLDYKDIIIKSYALNMSGAEIARQLGCSKSGVNDFLNAFKKCETLSFPLPEGITNYGIAELVYGKAPVSGNRDESFELPDYSAVHSQLTTRKNMTLIYQWNRYKKKCEADALKHYSYREWNAGYFIRRASVGNSIVFVIKSILSGWKLEVLFLQKNPNSCKAYFPSSAYVTIF